jgi:hypothetical protein
MSTKTELAHLYYYQLYMYCTTTYLENLNYIRV